MKKRTLTLWLMSSALLLNLSVGTALADEVVETGADNSPKVEATESTLQMISQQYLVRNTTLMLLIYLK